MCFQNATFSAMMAKKTNPKKRKQYKTNKQKPYTQNKQNKTKKNTEKKPQQLKTTSLASLLLYISVSRSLFQTAYCFSCTAGKHSLTVSSLASAASVNKDIFKKKKKVCFFVLLLLLCGFLGCFCFCFFQHSNNNESFFHIKS